MSTVYSFLLSGHVQGVKMRRYIESAARFFQVKGFVVNLKDGEVFGQAWVSDAASPTNDNSPLPSFRRWVRGEWPEVILTDVKPTPIGIAYPAKAREVSCKGLWETLSDNDTHHIVKLAETFVMVRDDAEAALLFSERLHTINVLRGPTDESTLVEISSWPTFEKVSH